MEESRRVGEAFPPDPPLCGNRATTRDALNAFLQRRFDGYYGRTEGAPFVVWTEKCTYFPVECDGAEGVGAVPLGPMTDFIPTHF